jgi:hypothetical protein
MLRYIRHIGDEVVSACHESVLLKVVDLRRGKLAWLDCIGQIYFRIFGDGSKLKLKKAEKGA